MKAISVKDLRRAQLAGDSKTLIDCRESSEITSGFIEGATFVKVGEIETSQEIALLERSALVVVYCQSGHRSNLAAVDLESRGFTNVASLSGGIVEWRKNLFPLAESLEPEGLARYRSQLNLQEVGLAGQLKIQKAKVLIIGAGGLGSPIATYLVGAGVGVIGLADYDKVEIANLHRQFLHSEKSIGKSKTTSAAQTLRSLNSQTKVVEHEIQIDKKNVDRLIADYDFVIDAADNFKTKYLINESCRRNAKVFVHGSVTGFSGQICVFGTLREHACYECLYAESPPNALAANCSDAGVLGPIVGVIGSMMATEILKAILELNRNSETVLQIWDGLLCRYDAFAIVRNPACPCSPLKESYQDADL